MSERTSGEGNTDAPRVEENEVRSGDGSRNQERSSGQGMSYELSHGYKKTSWTSVVFGWLAALGAGLILSGIVGGILGVLGVQGGTEGGIAGLVGVLVTLLLAFLIGGYVAGRLASRSGFKHGILVPCSRCSSYWSSRSSAPSWAQALSTSSPASRCPRCPATYRVRPLRAWAPS